MEIYDAAYEAAGSSIHSVMSEMNEHNSYIQLADILASEQHELYKVFSKERLHEIFKKICEFSLVLRPKERSLGIFEIKYVDNVLLYKLFCYVYQVFFSIA
ncbi:nuclear pore complex protein Nup107-like isoform X2 [Temnothorax curvispinosus]|uniref:Nuclear pore complex protein n=1 Tax=Temnothorax curvispinosus TaxID=300111 RepID=A0A6J1QRP9_9HYME|nr:nuclear pore complex protein Nup107-like isoform X2 [Temnothorax curvispinosus]